MTASPHPIEALIAALSEARSDDLAGSLASTVTMSVAVHDDPFDGPEAVLLILPLVAQALPDLHVEAPTVLDGDRAVAFLAATVTPEVPTLHLAVAVESVDGLATRIDVHARPLVSLAAFDALMGRLHFGDMPNESS